MHDQLLAVMPLKQKFLAAKRGSALVGIKQWLQRLINAVVIAFALQDLHREDTADNYASC